MTERRYSLSDVLLILSSQSTNTETLNANKTLATDSERIQFLDPNGVDRKITLPTEADSDGIIFWITNTDGGNVLNVYASNGITLLATISGSETGIFVCDGSAWTAGPVAAGPPVPSGSSMWFYQDVSPVGWSLIAAADSLLAVKGGANAYNVAGGNNAGTWVQPNHLHTTADHQLTKAEMPAHTHDRPDRYTWRVEGGQGGLYFSPYATNTVPTSSTGGGDVHNHGNTLDSGTPSTWRPQAYVGILARKD